MAPVDPPPRPSVPRFDLVALAIVALGCALRLYRLDVPFIDAHSWRQVTNADIARLWTEGPIDFFYPPVSWGGPDGRVGLEFPLLHLAMALVWRAVGISDIAGRLVPIAFSLVGIWWMYRLGTRLFDRGAGRAAAFLLAVSPSVVYFARTPISDTPMLTFSIGAVLGYVAYQQTRRLSHAIGAAAALALAGLVKIPAILVLGPIVWLALIERPWRLLKDPWYTGGLTAALGVTALWYLHADQIFQETGLTQAIFRPSGTYPSDIAQFAGPFTTVSHWTRAEFLTRDTFEELFYRYRDLHLTTIFAVVTLAGACTWRWPFRARSIVDVWTLAAFSLVAVSLAGQVPHEFHQLPTLAPLALYFGMAAGPLFAPEAFARFAPPARVALRVVTAVALTAIAWLGFVDSGVIQRLYRPDLLNTALMDGGRAIEHATPRDALLVTIEYERYGSNSPMLLYFAHRKGWSLDATAITPALITYLHDRRGACYVATSDWTLVDYVRPDVAAFLDTYPRIVLPDTHPRYQLFDLGCQAAGTPPR